MSNNSNNLPLPQKTLGERMTEVADNFNKHRWMSDAERDRMKQEMIVLIKKRAAEGKYSFSYFIDKFIRDDDRTDSQLWNLTDEKLAEMMKSEGIRIEFTHEYSSSMSNPRPAYNVNWPYMEGGVRKLPGLTERR